MKTWNKGEPKVFAFSRTRKKEEHTDGDVKMLCSSKKVEN